MGTDFLDIKISKQIDELKGMDDVLFEPRSWSPDDLKEACKNVNINVSERVAPLEMAFVYFLIKYFFFVQHQTGLYNLQRNLWSLIAKAEKVKIKRHKNPFWLGKDKYEYSDMYFEDSSSGKYILARLIHPNAKTAFPAFNSLIERVSSKCMGAFYITDQEYTEAFMTKVARKTNSKDPIDKYRSPISKNCSLNLVRYKTNNAQLADLSMSTSEGEPNSTDGAFQTASKCHFELIHPDIDRKIEVDLDVEATS